MTTGLVTVGRKQYACGLYWENSPSGRISQAAKEAARQPGSQADYFATRSGNKQGRVPQFGLAAAGAELRAGIPVLAACLANQQPGSWIGAFRMREGTALVVVRDDLIVPDGDQFFIDETEARDKLYQEMAIGGFQRIYAPEAWGVPGADTMPISLLLNDRADVRLHAVALSAKAKAGLAIGFALLLLVLGVGWYMQEKAVEEEQARLEQQAAMERARAEAARLLPGLQQQPVYPPPERVWEKMPRPLEVINACQETLKQVPVGIAGWRIAGLRCSISGLDVRWTRATGFANPPPRSVVSDNTATASASYSYAPALQPRGDESLMDPADITKRYLNQNWTGSINRLPDDPPPPPPPGYNGQWNPPPPPWVKRSFTLNVQVLPWTLPVFLTGLQGVVVNSLSLNGGGVSSHDVWTVEGVIYENRR